MNQWCSDLENFSRTEKRPLSLTRYSGPQDWSKIQISNITSQKHLFSAFSAALGESIQKLKQISQLPGSHFPEVGFVYSNKETANTHIMRRGHRTRQAQWKTVRDIRQMQINLLLISILPRPSRKPSDEESVFGVVRHGSRDIKEVRMPQGSTKSAVQDDESHSSTFWLLLSS